MTHKSLSALVRETPDSELRATWGTSPAATRARNKESATPLEATLSKLTATEIAALAIVSGVDAGELFDSISKNFTGV